MKIAVCIKQVPDSFAQKRLVSGVIERDGVDSVINSLDEFAIEEALQIAERFGGHGPDAPNMITLISMGPTKVGEALRKALSMGGDDAILVSDPALAQSDSRVTARVLSKVIDIGDYDLVFCGTESTDARMSVLPAMLAAELGWAQLTFANKLQIDPNRKLIQIQRVTERSVDQISAAFPAIVSVVEKINEPRFPSFKDIMAAKKKNITTLDLKSIGFESESVGLKGSLSYVYKSEPVPAKKHGEKIVDDGTAGRIVLNFLREKRLI